MQRPKLHNLTFDAQSALEFLDVSAVSLTYKDSLHGMSDVLTASIADPKGIWRELYAPVPQTVMTARFGYEQGMALDCGLFEVDQCEYQFGGGVDLCTISAISAILNEDLRKMRSEASENLTVADMVDKIAKRNGLTLIGSPPRTRLARETQRRQSDLSFLKRLALDHDCIFNVKGHNLIFIPAHELEMKPPVLSIDLKQGWVFDQSGSKVAQVINSAAALNSNGAYGSAHIRYFDGPKGKTLEHTQKANGIQSREVLEIDDRADSLAHARQLCQSQLKRANRDYKTMSFEITGYTGAIAGIRIDVLNGFKGQTGQYLVWESAHQFGSNSYTCSLDLKWCQDGVHDE